jgi:cysteinyl-tRNA synthetase
MFKLYSTFDRKTENFSPEEDKLVKIYSCGPTVYSRQTVGNFRTFVFSDLLRRSLEYMGYRVDLVMNITDVGHLTMTDEEKAKFKDLEITDTDAGLDRLEKAAKSENTTVWEIADRYTKQFFSDITKLNILPARVYPKATGHIPEQIEMITKLIDKGYAYVTKSAVYFETSKFKGYADIAGQSLDQKSVAVRSEVEKDPSKRNPADFRLWQLDQPDHSMQWDSPWGKGFPGWHIECSAMSMKYLGQPIDIHTGGADHITVHHPNEIAQSEAATGKKFVNYWMHGAFLVVDGKRMGKSLGNAYTIEDIEAKGYDGTDLRYFYLTAHYRQILNFTWVSLESAHNRLVKVRQTIDLLERAKPKAGKVIPQYKKLFLAALEHDLNLPVALAVFNQVVDADLDASDKLTTLKNFDEVLGLNLFLVKHENQDEIHEIESLIKQREKLRSEKHWEEADDIRKILLNKFHVTVEDSSGGTIWKRTGQ